MTEPNTDPENTKAEGGCSPATCSPLPVEVLDVMIDGDFTGTLRDFFKELSLMVWNEGEGFSGKRPWGNSGWEYQVFEALIKGGHVPGKLDSDGYIEECDDREITRLVTELVVEHL